MDFYKVIETRRSFRFYRDRMPEKDKIERILNAARLAPTWANMQGVEYIITQDPTLVKKLWKAIGQDGKFENAPMFISGIISEKNSGTNKNGQKYYGIDFGICFEHLILAATAEGLNTCWIGWFNEGKIKDILNVPEEYHILGLTPLGYATKKKNNVSDRKNLEEIIHWEKYKQ